MVAAVTTDVSQSFVLTAGSASDTVSSSMAYALVAGIYPAQSADASMGFVNIAAGTSGPIQVSQSYVLVACRMADEDPNIRVWTYTLDGHDFYILRLGTTETLVYDTLTEQWYNWASGETSLWRAYQGINWDGGNLWAAGYGSNVVVGDQGNGAVYFLNPDGYFDEDSRYGSESPRTFPREIVAQYPLHGRSSLPCFAVAVNGSIGNSDDGEATGIELLVSDDRGNNYVSCGEITNPSAEYSRRIEWRSLGSIRNPGRLFKVRDYGTIKRIDSLDVDDGQG